MSKTLTIAAKNLREAVRQPRVLLLSLGLPMVFMVIFGLAFGGDEGPDTFALAVVNHDEGELAASYVAGLSDLEFDDGRPLLRVVTIASEAEARDAVATRDVDGLLVVPADFSTAASPRARPTQGGPLPTQPGGVERVPPEGASVRVVGDPGFADFASVVRIVESYTQRFNAAVTGEEPPVAVEQDAVTSRELTQFDHIAPGIMVFAILNLVPQAATMLARESELGTLDRFRQSPSRAFHLLGGATLAQLVLAGASVLLMFGVARLMGFHNQGSYLAAYVVALAAAVSVIGIGMLVAAFARSQQEAANLGTLISVPASFLSGSFFAIPSVQFELAGRTVGLYDALPTTHAVEALRQVLTFGHALETVLASVAALVVLGLAFFAAGLFAYRRTRLAPA